VTLEVRRVRDNAELAGALALRREVFVGEQGVPVEHEVDEIDAYAIHLVAIAADDRVDATCRVFPDGEATMRVGRLCTRASARGRGLGAALLAEAEREARAAGAHRMVMNAQTAVMSLYLAAGYDARGGPFDEVGIEHLAMEKRLV
jgi:predicted GNAT family N-acyltransferase